MQALTFDEARACVLREVRAGMTAPATELVSLGVSNGRVLAEDIPADRDYPPFHRSMRDGFAVHATDLPGRVHLIGEVRAGATFSGSVGPGEAVEIMTGAPVPEGADAVVMVEYCVRHDDGTVSTDHAMEAGANISERGCEAKAGEVVLARGSRIDYTGVACLASAGKASVHVFTKPRVAILSTGDEVVEIDRPPAADQIRNSNLWSLAAQVERAGCIPILLPVARDTKEQTRELLTQGLSADLLLITGGVSAGKYDVVEPALAELGASFFFDRVRIQPGQPLVFGKALGKFFFGLPGNPASTMVTFEVFARAALELLSGMTHTSLPLATATLAREFHHRTGLTRFLPAELRGAQVTPVTSRGSGDIPALCRANVYLVADTDRPDYAAGESISILFK